MPPHTPAKSHHSHKRARTGSVSSKATTGSKSASSKGSGRLTISSGGGMHKPAKKYSMGRKSPSVTVPRVLAVHGEIKRVGSVVKLHKKSLKGLAKFGSWKLSDQGTAIVNSVEGKQGVASLFDIASYAQVIVSSGPSYVIPVQAPYSFFDSNPNQLPTGGLAGSLYNITPTAVNDDRVALRYVRATLEIGNMTFVSSVIVDLYWCIATADCNDAPDVVWANVLNSQKDGLSVGVQATTSTRATGGGSNVFMLGQRPNGTAFHKSWKVLKHFTFEMASGANVVNTMTFKYEKMIDRQSILERGTNAYLKGITIIPFVIQRGCIIKDNNANFSIAPTELAMVYTREYLLQCTGPARIRTQYTVPNLVSGGTSFTAVNVVDASGSVTTI
nr:MAG: capsid protein [Cressdnaviricota sp.]